MTTLKSYITEAALAIAIVAYMNVGCSSGFQTINGGVVAVAGGAKASQQVAPSSVVTPNCAVGGGNCFNLIIDPDFTNPTNQTSAKFTFAATSPVTGKPITSDFYCQLDTAAFVPCSS